MLLSTTQVYAQSGKGGNSELADFTGIWQRSGSVLSLMKLTEEGKKRSQETAAFDDPVVRCEGFSIARAGQSSFQVTKIEQDEESITFNWEQNAISNKVFLDGKRPSVTTNALITIINIITQNTISNVFMLYSFIY